MTGDGLRRAMSLGATAGLLLAGCLVDAPTPLSRPTPTPAPDPTATVTAYPLDTTIWYGGLILTFGTAIATVDAKGGPIGVDLTIQNPGEEDASLDGPILLTASGRAVQTSRETVVPLVPAGGRVGLPLQFVVDGAFDVASAVLRVGRSAENQALLPFVPGVVEPVTLEPVAAELTVEGQAGALRIELSGLELRADLPDWHQELPRGVLALTLTYSATFRSAFAGGFAFTADNVALRLPDGTTVRPRSDGHSQSILVIGPGVRESALRSRFEVPSPGGGAYALEVRDGSTTKLLPFSVELP
jgi:hypothetical protein